MASTATYTLLAIISALAGVIYWAVVHPSFTKRGAIVPAAHINYRTLIDDPSFGLAEVVHTERLDSQHTRVFFDNGEAKTYRKGELESEAWDEAIARRNRRVIYRVVRKGSGAGIGAPAGLERYEEYLDTPSRESELKRLRDDAGDLIAVEIQRAKDIGDIARPTAGKPRVGQE